MYSVKLVKKTNGVRYSENVSIERFPVPLLGHDYKVKVTYKNIQTAQLDVEPRSIIISLPNKYKKVESKNILDLAIEKMYTQIANAEIELIMEKMRITLGFAPEDYTITNMGSILAKCSDDNVFKINPLIMMYPKRVIEYIILHQYCHLKYKTHSKGFKLLLEEYMPDYKKYEKIIKKEHKY